MFAAVVQMLACVLAPDSTLQAQALQVSVAGSYCSTRAWKNKWEEAGGSGWQLAWPWLSP